jgi:rubrerythrin
MREFKTIREVFDYAIKRETDACLFYKQMASRVEKAEVRTAIKNLALDEQRHKMKLEAVRDGEIELDGEEVGSLFVEDPVEDARPYGEMSYKELLAFAIRKEAAAYQLYEKAAGLAKRKDIKELFLLLKQEETQHKLLLEVEYDQTAL